MNIVVISKYTTVPGLEKLPSRWYYLGKYLVTNHGCKVHILVGSYNHLNLKPLKFDQVNEVVVIKVLQSIKYTRTASMRRVLSWFLWEFQVLVYLFRRKERVDVIVASSLSLLSIMSALLFKLFNHKVKVVFEIRDIWPLTLYEESRVSRFHPLVLFLGFVEYIGIRFSDLIVGTMPGLGHYLLEHFKVSADVFISPLGVEVPRVEFDYPVVDDDGFYFKIGYAGSFGTTNGLEIFIDAIRLANTRNTKLRFYLFGEGDLFERYKTILASCNNVSFRRKIPANEIHLELMKFDLLYLSTHNSAVWKYGQSMNKIIDYMKVGKPIVCTYSGLESMINESNCGQFVRHCTADELLHVFEYYQGMSRFELTRIGLNGREWIYENRAYDVLANAYYSQLCLLY
jgi:glycosyltransferase involved in cell wall biosynthesis